MGRVTASRKEEIRVCVVERDPLARKYLEVLVAREGCIKLVAGAPLRRNRNQCDLPDVIVAAWDGPSTAARFVGALRRRAPKARILILGSRLPPDTIVSLLQAGADGFVDIEKVETDLLPAIRTLSQGRAWRRLEDFAAAARWAADRNPGPGKSDPRFTPREAEVVALVRQGLSNKQIASELGISEATAKFHLKNIFVKAGVSDRHAMAGVPPAGGVETRDRTSDKPTSCARPAAH